MSSSDCRYRGTSYCMTNYKQDCSKCNISGMDDEKLESMQQSLKITASLLPEEGIESLCEGDCKLCAGDTKNPKELYAVTDYAHIEPKAMRTSVIGIKVKSAIGSLLPIQIACCKTCASNHKKRDMLQWIITLVALVLAIGIMAIPGVQTLFGMDSSYEHSEPVSMDNIDVSDEQAMQEYAEQGGEVVGGFIPIVILIAVGILGALIGKIAQNAFQKSKSRQTVFDIGELPTIKKMVDNGWFPAFKNGETPKLLFTRVRKESLLSLLEKEEA